MVIAPAVADPGRSAAPEAELSTMVVAQLEASYLTANLGRGTASVRVLLPVPLELHAGYAVYVEPVRGGVDMLALGRVGLAWRPVDENALHVRIGGSLRHWQDGFGARFGSELLAGVDMFPAEPLVLGAEAGLGLVGDAWALEVRGTIGVLIEVVELYAGWHHLALEATNGTGGVELTGPIAGLRLWI